ncbi:MAG: hypothetical protein ACRD19_11335 [Terriglobia bacterium]
MTIGRNPGDERADEAGWPWSHRKTFLERLAAQGYAAVTIQEYRTIAGRFCDAIEKRGLRIGDLDAATTERLRHSVLSGVTGSARSYAKFCARRFIEHLIEAGAASAPQPPTKKSTPLSRLRTSTKLTCASSAGWPSPPSITARASWSGSWSFGSARNSAI